MCVRNTLPAIIVGLGLGAWASPARAELITWGFSGDVTQFSDPQGFFGGAIGLGDPFEGIYTFESTTPDSRPDTARRGHYENAITALAGFVDSIPFTGDGSPASIIRVDDSNLTPLTDEYFVGGLVQIFEEPMVFHLSLYRNDGSFLFSDSLPIVPPGLGGMTAMSVGVSIEGGPSIQAQLMNVWLVPEPGTFVALTICGAAILIRRRSMR